MQVINWIYSWFYPYPKNSLSTDEMLESFVLVPNHHFSFEVFKNTAEANLDIWTFEVVTEDSSVSLREIAAIVATAAEQRMERIEKNSGRLRFVNVTKAANTELKNPFDAPFTCKKEISPNQVTAEYFYLDIATLLPRENLLDTRTLAINDTPLLCPAQTLRDYERWGQGSVLIVDGEVIDWVSPQDALVSLSDVKADEIIPAPAWLKKTSERFGDKEEAFKRMIYVINQLILNTMFYQIQDDFQRHLGLTLFPDPAMKRSIQIFTDGPFRKAIMAISGKMIYSIVEGNNEMLKIAPSDKSFGFFQGVAVFNLDLGSAYLRTHARTTK